MEQGRAQPRDAPRSEENQMRGIVIIFISMMLVTYTGCERSKQPAAAAAPSNDQRDPSTAAVAAAATERRGSPTYDKNGWACQQLRQRKIQLVEMRRNLKDAMSEQPVAAPGAFAHTRREEAQRLAEVQQALDAMEGDLARCGF